jgi:hypothetical protein
VGIAHNPSANPNRALQLNIVGTGGDFFVTDARQTQVDHLKSLIPRFLTDLQAAETCRRRQRVGQSDCINLSLKLSISANVSAREGMTTRTIQPRAMSSQVKVVVSPLRFFADRTERRIVLYAISFLFMTAGLNSIVVELECDGILVLGNRFDPRVC